MKKHTFDKQKALNIANTVIHILTFSVIATLMLVITAQRVAPHYFNKWLAAHPNVPLLSYTREPQLIIGTDVKFTRMDISRSYGVAYLPERKIWCYDEVCWGPDISITNPDMHTFHVWVHGIVGIKLDEENAIGACRIAETDGDDTYLEIGKGCSVLLQTGDPLGYIQVSYEPFPDP